MEKKVIFNDLGEMDYAKAWDYQRNLHSQILDLKKVNEDLPVCEQTANYNYLLFCEHPHVYTIGKSGSENNLLIDEKLLEQKGAQLFKIDRGGDITYHGPGQIVGYPIIDLSVYGLGVREYIHAMEESIIKLLAEYGIIAERLEGATGVWLDTDKPGKTRKICAIGVKVSRAVTMHGFAFNVNTDLAFYNYINPCGFIDKGVTSMEKELGKKLDMDEVKNKLLNYITEVFGFDIFIPE
ncbi:lipoyl(octanoyl) transferase LipB [Desulfosarcina sp.]|nr:lipoyl(octanoyl) transferase LipB [Desulfosarcina sp.]